MPATETLANLRLRAQQEANMVNSTLVTSSEWNTWANSEYRELYEMLVSAGGNWVETTVNLVVGTDIVAGVANLPSDFLGVKLVSRQLNTNFYVDLKEAYIQEISRFITSATFATHYRLANNTIVLFPQPTATGQIYRLIYIPVPALLSADGDTVNGVNGWEEFVVLGMAVRALQKIESDASPLQGRKLALQKRIEMMRDLRNMNEARRVVDVSDDGRYFDGASWYPLRGIR